MGFALASLVVVGVGTAYVFVTRGWADQRERLQTQQQLRSAVATLSREVRLAGACMMPAPAADFQPIDGVDNGTTDTITVRSNPRCAQTVMTSACPPGCLSFTVDAATKFLAGTWAYVYLNGTTHQYFKIAGIVGNTITVGASTPITATYPPIASSVFGIEERRFAISSTCVGCGGIPSVTLQTLDLPETPLVKGIDRLDIRYVLNRNYDAGTCDASSGGPPALCVLNLPSTPADWRLVRAVTFDVGARSRGGVRGAGGDGYFRLGEIFEITPRNFVFSSGRL